MHHVEGYPHSAAFFIGFRPMYLLYLDDSGSVQNPSDTHIILAGLALYESQAYWFGKCLDDIAAQIWPDNPTSLEFRGTSILSGKSHWRGIEHLSREQAYAKAMTKLGQSKHVHIFAVAIEKSAVSPEDPMELAFEHICYRFDRFLGRLHAKGNTQRGLIIMDKSSDETSLQHLARDFRTRGHRWGQLYNLADVPLFADSKSTRLIQFADMVAHATRRVYERQDATYFDLFAPRIDRDGGTLHGMVHLTQDANTCSCYPCRIRRTI